MKKIVKRIMSIIFVLVICGIQFSMLFGSAYAATWQSKIDDALWEAMETATDKLDVIIFRNLIPDEIKNAEILKMTGYNVDHYHDKDLFNTYVKALIVKQTVEKYGDAAYSTQEYEQQYGEKVSQIDLAINEAYDNFVMAKRNVVSNMYQVSNADFIRNHIPDKNKISYAGTYTSTIIANLSVSEIKRIASDSTVQSIRFFEDLPNSPALNNVLEQINVDDVKGNSYNSGTGYKGTGIKIGILEPAFAIYDPTALQLSSIHNSEQLQKVHYATSFPITSEIISDHATMVTSIIVGQSYTISGKTYEGVVPNSTVYQAAVHYTSDVFTCLQSMASLGVMVVNYSGGSGESGDYNLCYDEEVDRIINETGMTVVVAAGNEGLSTEYVSSPGKAYNAITVANANTITNALGIRSKKNAPYNIASSSSFRTAPYLTAKPDISAPGSNIAIAKNSTITPYVDSGTSFAAPIVTGIVAQIMQASPSSRDEPTEIKAILLRGANPNAISDTDNNVSVGNSGLIRDKSGLGMVDAKATIDYIFSSTAGELTYKYNTQTIPVPYVNQSPQKYYTAGQTVRAVLVFSKPDDNIDVGLSGYPTDVDITLINSAGNIVAQSTSLYNNVEVFEYTIEASGYYRFTVALSNVTSTNQSTTLAASLAYCVK